MLLAVVGLGLMLFKALRSHPHIPFLETEQEHSQELPEALPNGVVEAEFFLENCASSEHEPGFVVRVRCQQTQWWFPVQGCSRSLASRDDRIECDGHSYHLEGTPGQLRVFSDEGLITSQFHVPCEGTPQIRPIKACNW